MSKPNAKKHFGFTFIETLVVLGLIGLLAAAVINRVDPVKQLQKARDSQRKVSFTQLQTALDSFYTGNNNKYPISTTSYEIEGAPWGKAWNPYMKQVPKDPLMAQKYVYVSSGECYHIYAKLENTADPQSCGQCGPDGAYNYGVTCSSGSPLLSWSTAPGAPVPTGLLPSPTPTPTATPTSTETPTPTPTPSPLPSGDGTYFIGHQDNPQFMKAVFNPFGPTKGQTQEISVDIRDTTSSPIKTVSAIVTTDNGSGTPGMVLGTGTNTNGTWSGTWTVNDSYNTTYKAKFTATNEAGKSSQVELVFR